MTSRVHWHNTYFFATPLLFTARVGGMESWDWTSETLVSRRFRDALAGMCMQSSRSPSRLLCLIFRHPELSPVSATGSSLPTPSTPLPACGRPRTRLSEPCPTPKSSRHCGLCPRGIEWRCATPTLKACPASTSAKSCTPRSGLWCLDCTGDAAGYACCW